MKRNPTTRSSTTASSMNSSRCRSAGSTRLPSGARAEESWTRSHRRPISAPLEQEADPAEEGVAAEVAEGVEALAVEPRRSGSIRPAEVEQEAMAQREPERAAAKRRAAAADYWGPSKRSRPFERRASRLGQMPRPTATTRSSPG